MAYFLSLFSWIFGSCFQSPNEFSRAIETNFKEKIFLKSKDFLYFLFLQIQIQIYFISGTWPIHYNINHNHIGNSWLINGKTTVTHTSSQNIHTHTLTYTHTLTHIIASTSLYQKSSIICYCHRY